MFLRKISLVILASFLLTGCAGKQMSYDQMIQKSLSRPLPPSNNKSKQYIKYYTLPDVGIKESNQLSTLYEVSGNKVMLSIDVPKIIQRKYYKDSEMETGYNKDDVLYSYSGTYLDNQDKEQKFNILIYEVGSKKGIIMENNSVNLIGIVNDSDMLYVMESMLTTLRSSTVNEEKIAAEYSNKEIIQYKATHENFFEQAVPESGSMIDMYNQLHPDDPIKIDGNSDTKENASEDTNNDKE